MSIILAPNPQSLAFKKDAVDLFSRHRAGHTGKWCWTKPELWAAFAEHNPFYHVFNEDCALVALHADKIAELTGHLSVAVDYGRGSPMAFERKLLPILARTPNLQKVISLDVSDEFPVAAAAMLHRWNPEAKIETDNLDFLKDSLVVEKPAFGFFVGSTLSNIVLAEDETLTEGCARTLSLLATGLRKGSILIFSYDTCRNPAHLQRTYGDPFLDEMELSLIDRMNNELGMRGATAQDFRVVNNWYPDQHLFAKELEVQGDAEIRIGDFRRSLEQGERFWSASCYKPSQAMIAEALELAHLRPIYKAVGPNMVLEAVTVG
jgi:uncharacterized SAM-dependent methyltransferase